MKRMLRNCADRPFLAVILAALAACGRGPAEPAGGDFQDLPADQVMVGVDFVQTSQGVRVGTLRSDTAFVFSDSSVMHLRGVNLELHDENGQRKAHLTSLTGVLNNQTQAMIARGDVVLIVMANGRRIETPELHYDPQTRRVWSDSTTRMSHQGETFTAEGFTSDDEFRNVQTGRVRGRTGVRIEF
jgi:LPS export ABC transporter protein LptC